MVILGLVSKPCRCATTFVKAWAYFFAYDAVYKEPYILRPKLYQTTPLLGDVQALKCGQTLTGLSNLTLLHGLGPRY